jgi:hypothetical protein
MEEMSGIRCLVTETEYTTNNTVTYTESKWLLNAEFSNSGIGGLRNLHYI